MASGWAGVVVRIGSGFSEFGVLRMRRTGRGGTADQAWTYGQHR